jgi:hypothetical protein
MPDFRITLGGAALAIASPVAAQEGPVVVWFGDPPAAVSDKLAILCADTSASVVEQDDRHVLCQRQVTGGKGILAQALLGNSYSTSPQMMVRFQILRDGTAARVQASQWIELQMAGGQTRRNDLNDRKARASLEEALLNAGGHNAPPDLLPEPVETMPKP